MRQGIEGPGNHLFLRYGIGVEGIEQRETGIELRIIAACLGFQIFIGDDGAAVHFTARAGRRHDDAKRDGREIDGTAFGPEVSPNIALIDSGQGHGFAAVHDGTAADGQNQIGLMIPGQRCAFEDFFVRRIGHDAREFRHCLAGFFQDAHHFIINAVFFDRAAAVG